MLVLVRIVLLLLVAAMAVSHDRHIVFEPMSFEDAVNHCRNMNLSLLAILKEAKNTEIYEVMNMNNLTKIWIGMSRDKSAPTDEKPWIWKFERDPYMPLTNSFWGPGEPNNFRNRRERCVEVRVLPKNTPIKNWNDANCGIRNAFLCEKLKAPL